MLIAPIARQVAAAITLVGIAVVVVRAVEGVLWPNMPTRSSAAVLDVGTFIGANGPAILLIPAILATAAETGSARAAVLHVFSVS